MPNLLATEVDSEFRRLNALTTLKRLVRPEPTEERTKQEERDGQLSELSTHPYFALALIPMIEERVEEFEQAIPQYLSSHPQLCALEGRKAEALTYLKLFRKLIEGE